ncbi:MAG: ABC transporter substrate-binding protein, partial [Leptolyngbya sp. SIO4C1]|nr:ABC transporter substrate-binding protein [Leptolyngbya sp. SIO4C1]
GAGYEAAIARLRAVAALTGRMPQAESVITALNHQLQACGSQLQQPQKTVLMMGGSTFNRLINRYAVETDSGTLGSVLRQLTRFPWHKPDSTRGEAGLTYLSLQQIAAVNADVILVQSYPPISQPLSEQLATDKLWQQLRAVKAQQIYEVNPFWHWGNGTRLIRTMLDQLLPLIYPDCFAAAIASPSTAPSYGPNPVESTDDR